jgi:hypothetical protein
MRTTVGLAIAALLPTHLAAQAKGSYALRGERPTIYNLAGTVRVEPGTGDAVVVEVSPGGADAAGLRVAQGPLRGRETLRVIYPGDRIRYPGSGAGSNTSLRVRNDGTFGDADGNDDDSGRRVRISNAGDEAWADLRIAVPAGHRMALRLAVGTVTLSNVDGRIEVSAQAGPISATGGRGELGLETGSGGIEVTRFQGEHLAAETGSGDVSATGLEAREVSIETGSGDVRLSEIKAPALSVETGSGGVTVDLRSDVETLTVETGSGNVSLTAPESLGARLHIETGSGDIDSDFPVNVTQTARDQLTGTVGNGRGTISVETGSGSVRLLKAKG